MGRKTLRIANPCRQDWDSLPRTPEGFFCRDCGKTVHDLTSMTRREAEAYRARLPGPLCVRMRKGIDGEPIFAPEPGPRGRAPATAVLAVALAACGSPSTTPGAGPPPAVVAPPAPAAYVAAPPPPAAPPPVAPVVPPPVVPPDPSTPDPTPEQAALIRSAHRAAHHGRHAPLRLGPDNYVSGGLSEDDL